MTITYQVGELLRLDHADPELDTHAAAINLAVSESIREQETPFGIWTGQGHGSELVAIAYQGQIFKSTF